MSRTYVPYIGALALLWGASYMFIKVGVREYEPAAMIMFRLVIASVLLLAVFLAQRGFTTAVSDLRALGWQGFGVGVANGAIPFTLIAWGEKHIDSGVAAIANATVPIFVAILAIRFNPSERVRGLRLAGVVLGLVGVGVLTGLHPQGGWWGAAGTLAVVVASLSYASANLFTQHTFPRTSPLVITTASTLAASLVLLPFALFQLPDAVPSWKALASVAALGLAGTALALLFFYAMLARYGASRSSLVTYLLPPFALFYGLVFLGERMTLNALLGLLLILAGVALGSGVFQLARWRTAEPAAPRP
jgi:drug/metabolite transporter (DMT)-like permease